MEKLKGLQQNLSQVSEINQSYPNIVQQHSVVHLIRETKTMKAQIY
jgi:hypothetical protein